MILLVAALLFLPVSAAIAALVVGLTRSEDELDDGALVRHFLFVMAIVMLVLWGAGRTDPVRRRIDPFHRVALQVEADPVVTAVVALDREQGEPLRADVSVRLLEGATMDAALAAWRPWLFARATDRLGFADQKAHLAWGRVVAASLDELAATRPEACWRLDAGVADDFAFSEENGRAFRDAFVTVYASAERGLRRDWPADERAAEYDVRQAASLDLHQRLDQDFGPEIGRSLRSRDRSPPPDVPWSLLCTARRAQLDAMLALPQPVAASLVDSLLR